MLRRQQAGLIQIQPFLELKQPEISLGSGLFPEKSEGICAGKGALSNWEAP